MMGKLNAHAGASTPGVGIVISVGSNQYQTAELHAEMAAQVQVNAPIADRAMLMMHSTSPAVPIPLGEVLFASTAKMRPTIPNPKVMTLKNGIQKKTNPTIPMTNAAIALPLAGVWDVYGGCGYGGCCP